MLSQASASGPTPPDSQSTSGTSVRIGKRSAILRTTRASKLRSTWTLPDDRLVSCQRHLSTNAPTCLNSASGAARAHQS